MTRTLKSLIFELTYLFTFKFLNMTTKKALSGLIPFATTFLGFKKALRTYEPDLHEAAAWLKMRSVVTCTAGEEMTKKAKTLVLEECAEGNCDEVTVDNTRFRIKYKQTPVYPETPAINKAAIKVEQATEALRLAKLAHKTECEKEGPTHFETIVHAIEVVE